MTGFSAPSSSTKVAFRLSLSVKRVPSLKILPTSTPRAVCSGWPQRGQASPSPASTMSATMAAR